MTEPSDSGVHPRLLELAEAFFACRVAFFGTAEFHWEPAPGSAAERDAAALPSPDPRVKNPAGATGFLLVSEAISSYLLVASAHMGGLAALHAAGEVIFPPGILVRSVLENCAHAMWIPGDTPEEPAGSKLARAYLEELISAEEAKKNAGRLEPKTSPQHQDAAAEFKRRRQEALDVFPGTTPEDLAKRQLAGQQLPNPEACVAWMYRLLESATASSIDERTGTGVYGFLSNMTHPTLYPARQLRVWHEADGHAGHMTSTLYLDIGFVERQASAAIVVFYNALAYITSYYGWPPEPHDRLTAAIDRILPGTITP
jgi:hypothetical protein